MRQSDSKRLAAMNLSLLASYGALYGKLPESMVDAIYKKLMELPPETTTEQYQVAAKALAHLWLASQSTAGTPSSNIGTGRPSGSILSGVESGNADTEQSELN